MYVVYYTNTLVGEGKEDLAVFNLACIVDFRWDEETIIFTITKLNN